MIPIKYLYTYNPGSYSPHSYPFPTCYQRGGVDRKQEGEIEREKQGVFVCTVPWWRGGVLSYQLTQALFFRCDWHEALPAQCVLKEELKSKKKAYSHPLQFVFPQACVFMTSPTTA